MNLGLDRKMLCTNLTLEEGSVKLPLMNTNQTVITFSALCVIKYRQMLSKH